MMIADHGELVTGQSGNMRVDDGDTKTDATTGKPVQQTLKYTVTAANTVYVVTYQVRNTIDTFKMIEQLHGVQRILASAAGFDGAYLRFTGEIMLDKFVDGKRVDHAVNNDGIWELMYFGKTIAE